MSQLICQSDRLRVTRSCTRKAGNQETKLKYNSKLEVEKAHKTNKPNPKDTEAKRSRMGKAHPNFLYWWCLAKADFPLSYLPRRNTLHKINCSSQEMLCSLNQNLQVSDSKAGNGFITRIKPDRAHTMCRHCKDMGKSRQISELISIVGLW